MLGWSTSINTLVTAKHLACRLLQEIRRAGGCQKGLQITIIEIFVDRDGQNSFITMTEYEEEDYGSDSEEAEVMSPAEMLQSFKDINVLARKALFCCSAVLYRNPVSI